MTSSAVAYLAEQPWLATVKLNLLGGSIKSLLKRPDSKIDFFIFGEDSVIKWLS